jgi:hypothetical protein
MVPEDCEGVTYSSANCQIELSVIAVVLRMFKERYRLVDFDYLAAAVAHNETGFLFPRPARAAKPRFSLWITSDKSDTTRNLNVV